MKYLEIIPDLLTMFGVFTSQSTSQVRQEMSSMYEYTEHESMPLHSFMHFRSLVN